jgi:hypothetical protein
MQFPPISRHFISLRTKYSPQHPVLKHPQLHCIKNGYVCRAKVSAVLLQITENTWRICYRYVFHLFSLLWTYGLM